MCNETFSMIFKHRVLVEESLLNEQKLPNKVAHKEMHLVLHPL